MASSTACSPNRGRRLPSGGVRRSVSQRARPPERCQDSVTGSVLAHQARAPARRMRTPSRGAGKFTSAAYGPSYSHLADGSGVQWQRGHDPAFNQALPRSGPRRVRRLPGHADGYRPRRPIGLPSASSSTHTRASGATLRGALRSVAPAPSRVARVASRSSTSA
jgi:hypothetical protein